MKTPREKQAVEKMELGSLDIDRNEKAAIYLSRKRNNLIGDLINRFDLCENRGQEATYANKDSKTALAYSKSIDFDLKPGNKAATT